MNDGYSVSTESLRDVAKEIRDVADEFRETYGPKVDYLEISALDLPQPDPGFKTAYDSLRDRMSSACMSVSDALDEVHKKLKKTVDRYEEVDESHSTDMDGD